MTTGPGGGRPLLTAPRLPSAWAPTDSVYALARRGGSLTCVSGGACGSAPRRLTNGFLDRSKPPTTGGTDDETDPDGLEVLDLEPDDPWREFVRS